MNPLQKTTHLFLASLLLILVTRCQAPSTEEDVIPTEDFKIIETIEVDSVVADFPVGFRFLNTADRQFIAYYNKDRTLTVAARKTAESAWVYQVLPSKVGWDSHNRIVMDIDRQNCLHISGNMHNDTLVYFKTQKPFDINTFQRVLPMVALQDELRCTYPSFIKNGKDQLIFSYRKGGSGNGINLTNSYDEATQSFQRLTDQPLFDGLGQMSAYASGPHLGPDSLFHVIWFWRDTPACETNHDLSYARSPDLVNWETANGQKIKLPIHPNIKKTTVDPVPPGGGVINGGARLFFDNNKQPLIAYMKYDTAGKSQIYLAKPSNGGWQSKQISDWDYRWNFSGPGSIDFDIRIKRAFMDSNGKITVAYDHIKNGTGELIVNGETFLLLEDRTVAKSERLEYPADLLLLQSGMDSAQVRWLKANTQDGNPKTFYALRWETMGKRRFYKPPSQPVQPSALKLYLLERE